jgi:hypothetical protein
MEYIYTRAVTPIQSVYQAPYSHEASKARLLLRNVFLHCVLFSFRHVLVICNSLDLS